MKQSEDGRYLGIGYESGFLQIWDVQTQECVGELSLSDTQISTVSFTPDGTIAALGSGGKIVQVWDVVKRKYLHTLYFKYRVSNVSFPGNEHILECQFSNGTYRKVNIDDGRVGAGDAAWWNSICCSKVTKKTWKAKSRQDRVCTKWKRNHLVGKWKCIHMG